MECISYHDGYKYQLKADYITGTGVLPDEPVETQFVDLSTAGRITVKNGYAWDGPSGPTIDTLNFMRGSLVHDALYQLMRERRVDASRYKDVADRLLQTMCKQDGMTALRAWFVYQAVRLFGDPTSDPAKRLIRAPRQCR
jgi:hypothetical protein